MNSSGKFPAIFGTTNASIGISTSFLVLCNSETNTLFLTTVSDDIEVRGTFALCLNIFSNCTQCSVMRLTWEPVSQNPRIMVGLVREECLSRTATVPKMIAGVVSLNCQFA